MSSYFLRLLFFVLLAVGTPAHADWEIPMKMLNGQPMATDLLEDKVVVFVNVASKCGFTGQYTDLQKLYDTYKDRGLVVVGVPCNQFGGQEPGTADEIASFCSINYGVTFPILEKQDVKGANRSDLYNKLVDSKVGDGSSVKWNFEKFVVGRDGEVVARFRSPTGPTSSSMTDAIDAALAN